jgi:hypothetical protein
LFVKPSGSALERFNQGDINIGANHGNNQPRQPCSTSNIREGGSTTRNPGCRYLGGKQCAVKNVPRPEPSRFVRTNQSEHLTSRPKVERKLSNTFNGIAAQLFRDKRFWLYLGMFHVKLCAANYGVAVSAFAL